MNVFTMSIEVFDNHIDDLGHVNNVQYLNWVQEAAHAHWELLTKNANKSFGVWVVRSHSITYKKPAFKGDLLALKTYVKQSRGALSERIVELFNSNQ
jgi:acyl-CoA thioester hydrolase